MDDRLFQLHAKQHRTARRVATMRRKLQDRIDPFFADRVFRLVDEADRLDWQRAEIAFIKAVAA